VWPGSGDCARWTRRHFARSHPVPAESIGTILNRTGPLSSLNGHVSVDGRWAFALLRALSQPQIDALVIVGALVLSFLTRLPFLKVPLITDEGGYAYAAQRWLSGQGVLYQDLFFDRPQGIFLVYGLIQNTLGTSLVAIRLGAWIATGLTLVLVWLIAKEICDRRVAALAAVVFGLIAGSPSIEGFTANAEVFMALPSAACIYVLLRASRNDWDRRSIVVTGMLVGAATLVKQSGVTLVPVVCVFAGLCLAGRPRKLIATWWWFGFGCALAVAPALAQGWHNGWKSFLEAVGGRVGSRSVASIPPIEQLRSIIELIGGNVLLVLTIIAIALLRTSLIKRPKRMILCRVQLNARMSVALPAISSGAEGSVLIRLWGVGCIVGIAMGGNWFPHYLVQIGAPLAIWIAMETVALRPRLSTVAYRGLVAAFIIAMLSPYGLVLETRGNVDAMSVRVFDRTTYGAEDEVAAYVQQNSTPDQSIYVAFFQASLYYLAQRPAAYKHLYLWELQANPSAEDELIAMVQAPNRPIYIVDVGLSSPFPNDGARFWAVVRSNYRIETEIGGMKIYRVIAGPT
jgi:4-amino-4-deoxy-L-arabinose transferase-like glycosyltransferase